MTAFTTLLAAAGPCEQQNAADQMVDLAKGLKSDAQMIKLAQIFAQQPRNTVSVVHSTCPRFSFLHWLSAIFGKRPVLPTGAQELRIVRTVPMPICRGEDPDVRRWSLSWEPRHDSPRAFLPLEPRGVLPRQSEWPDSRWSTTRRYHSEPRLWR